MSKPILIALLVVLLAGGGIAFAQTGAVNELLGLEVPPEIEGGDDSQSFGEEVSEDAQDLGQEMDPEEIIPDIVEEVQIREDGNDGNGEGEENRSDVAEAVLDVLDDGSSPGDENFGENVSSQAKDNGKELGEKVSDAAKEKGKELGGVAPDTAGKANSSTDKGR